MEDGSLAGHAVHGAVGESDFDAPRADKPARLAPPRVSLSQSSSDDFFGAYGVTDGLDGLDEWDDPPSLLDEARELLAAALAPENRQKLALRVIPLAAVLIAGVMFWPSNSNGNETAGVALRTAITAAPGVGTADDGPGLAVASGEADRKLYVETSPDAAEQSLARLGTTETTGPEVTEEQDATSTTEDGSTDGRQTTSSAAAGATADDSSAQDTDRQSTTTEVQTTTTTEAPSTRAPATPAPTNAPPATPAPTTAPPATPAPTDAPPATPAPTTAPPPPPPSNNCAGGGEFETVFRDDFNGSSVRGEWSQYNSTGNAGYGLRRPSAISVRDGKLVITARMENGNLVSGGMQHGYGQTYGKYVFRVRTDNDPSQAVSGVILTWPQSGVHPRDGENNIYETLVQTANRNPFFTFIHKPYGSHSDQEYKEHHADGSQWQTMTMEWTPDRITITREGPGRDGNWDSWTVTETGADLIPDVPHRLAIQLDGWKHSIQGEVKMEVDFVEVSKYCG